MRRDRPRVYSTSGRLWKTIPIWYWQYQILFDKYHFLNLVKQLINTFGDDLKVLAFPCNQFGKQEPGTAREIKDFVKKYNFTGRLFSKCDVNGDDAHPVFQWLKYQKLGSGTLTDNIKWNFTKFLLDKEGNVVGRWGTVTAAGDLEKEIRKLL